MDGPQPPPPPAPAPARGGGGGGVFTRRIGPLPMWVWLVIVGGIIVAYALYTRSKNPQAPQPQDSGGQDSGTGGGVQQIYLTGTPAGATTPAVPSPTGDSSQGPIVPDNPPPVIPREPRPYHGPPHNKKGGPGTGPPPIPRGHRRNHRHRHLAGKG